MLLLLMAFLLGIRHGFDLDHLATIDSITRVVKKNPRLANFVGCLFSLGHGMVVILMSFILQNQWVHHPEISLWLEPLGHWISIIFLLLFAVLTICKNVKTQFIQKLFTNTNNPWLIILVGALFAFSFDTFTQVALFSISATIATGYYFSIILGIVFMLGMMASDGLNGFVVSSIIQFADHRSMLASQIIGIMIASFSMVLAVIGLLHELRSLL